MTIQETSPGTRLRQAREAAGMTLAEIAQRTLIPIARLRALEKDDYAQVGVTTFVVGYTRTYARILGLDPTAMVEMLEARLSSQSPTRYQAPAVALSLEVRKRPGSMFWPFLLIFLVVLVAVAVVGISTLGGGAPTEPIPVPPPASTPLPALEAPNEWVAPEISGSDSIEGARDPAQEMFPEVPQELSPDVLQEQSQEVSQELLEVRDYAEVETAPQTAEAPLAAPAASTPPAELVLNLADDCWVDVTDATGKRIVARNAASGDNLRLFGQPPFDVILGNAAAVEMTLNGQPVDTTPPAGRRMLRFSVAP
jgi:cytoskeleton protein RodZ